MIDLHCHILPKIDDGAKDVDEAELMLDMQRSSGVKRVFLTPHFYPEEKTIDTFLSERENAWNVLNAAHMDRENMQLRLGAEVRYGEQLLSLDLNALTLGESNYLLLELPGSRYPSHLPRFLEELLDKGLIPILAHVERYNYFRQESELLRELVDLGVLAQISAQTLFDKRDMNFSVACLAHGLAHIVASDAHNANDRRPCMEEIRKLPEELRQLNEAATTAVWDNELPPYIRTTAMKKNLFGYR